MTRPIVLTGGGTGGHVFPLRAIADALVTAGVASDDLVVVGSRRGQEGVLLADLGVEVVLLPGRGIRRSVRPRALVQNVGAIVGLVAALVEGVVLTVRRRPRAVVSVGGYAAFAAATAAVLTARPLVLVDLDAEQGLVHRLLSRFAVAITSPFATGSPRVVVTGVPLRDEILAVTRDPAQRQVARERLGLEGADHVVAVMSGSIGASSINRAVSGLAARWRGTQTATLYHVTGMRDLESVRAAKRTAQIDDADWQVVGFETSMGDVWAACDVAVCRAGATTVAELCATGVPSVLVALPGAPGGHQEANAAVLEGAGAALVLVDADLSAAKLDAVLTPLLGDDAERARMSTAARGLSRADAAARVAAVVLDHAR